MQIRKFETQLGDKATVSLSRVTKAAFIVINGKDYGKVKRCQVFNAFTCIKTLNNITGSEIWRLV